MAQRESGYARQEHDAYWTPAWVYEALYSVEPAFRGATDVAPRDAFSRGYDFLADLSPLTNVATNPPFHRSDEFVVWALNRTRINHGRVAMLLPIPWDTARKRVNLFTDCHFRAKYILTRRIRWENLEQKKNGPSTNHAWYIWDWEWEGTPMIGWLT